MKFYKPRGVICARAPDAYSLKPHTACYFPDAPRELHNAGRLDGDSEGLLLMTTDGHFSHFVTRPGGEKEYLALTSCARDGRPPTACLEALVKGVKLADGPAKALRAELVDFDGLYARLRIVVQEGRKRMVRRMLRHVGYCCMQLLRLSSCGIAGAVVPQGLAAAAQEAQLFKRHQLTATVRAARVAEDHGALRPGDVAPLAPHEVLSIYASALEKVGRRAPRRRGHGAAPRGAWR